MISSLCENQFKNLQTDATIIILEQVAAQQKRTLRIKIQYNRLCVLV